MMREAAIKAYAVNEKYENTGAIFFAKHDITARRMGADEYGDGELSYVTCRRAPWADHCAETGIVPVSLMVENGWHFECTGCGVRIDTDLCHIYEEEIDDPENTDKALRFKDWNTDDIIGHQHSQVFCNQACQDDHLAHRAECERRQDRVIARFRAIILRRFPGVEFPDDRERYRGYAHAYVTKLRGRWHVGQVHVPFNFPGQQFGPASLDYDPDSSWQARRKVRFYCTGGDKERFETFAASTKPATLSQHKRGGA